jgi:WD40 repeat protein
LATGSGRSRFENVGEIAPADPESTFLFVDGASKFGYPRDTLTGRPIGNRTLLWDLQKIGDPAAMPQELRGHVLSVAAIAFSPDCRWLATGGADARVRLWDLKGDLATPPRVLSEHLNRVEIVAFSPDGKWLATGGADIGVYLWDLSQGDVSTVESIILPNHENGVAAVVFGREGRWLYSVDRNATLRRWDLAGANPASNPTSRSTYGNAVAAALDPTGSWLAVGNYYGTVDLWDLRTQDLGESPAILRGHEKRVSVLAFSDDGATLVTGSHDNTVRLWDMTAKDPGARSRVLRAHERSLIGAAFGGKNSWLATAADEPTPRLSRLTGMESMAEPQTLRVKESFGAPTLSPDGRWFVDHNYSGALRLRLWDLENAGARAEPQPPLKPEELSHEIAFSPDSRRLLGRSSDGITWIWDLSGATAERRELSGLEKPTAPAVFSTDGRWLAMGNQDGAMRLWDLESQDRSISPRVLRGPEGVRRLVVGPQGRWMATFEQVAVRLWPLMASDPAAESKSLSGHQEWIASAAFSPDGRWFLTGSGDTTVRLWPLARPDPAAESVVLEGHGAPVEELAISPDGRWLVAGNAGNVVYSSSAQKAYSPTMLLWDLQAREPGGASRLLAKDPQNITKWAFTPNGRWLATSGHGPTVQLRDLQSDDPTAAPINLRGHDNTITHLALSPDGRWLATGADGEPVIRLWDLASADPAAEPRSFGGHDSEVKLVSFTGDGRTLLTVDQNTVRRWRIPVDELIEVARQLAGRELTPEERVLEQIETPQNSSEKPERSTAARRSSPMVTAPRVGGASTDR